MEVLRKLSCEQFSEPSTKSASSCGKEAGQKHPRGCQTVSGRCDLEVHLNLNKLLRTALKTGLYFLEQSGKATAPIRRQVKDQVEGLTDRTRQTILGPEDHTVRNTVSLAAGIGLGIALGLLFAPASGEEIRRSIVEKAQNARARVRETISS